MMGSTLSAFDGQIQDLFPLRCGENPGWGGCDSIFYSDTASPSTTHFVPSSRKDDEALLPHYVVAGVFALQFLFR